jgi:uncharacterized protein YjeT (DUF2065 family)
MDRFAGWIERLSLRGAAAAALTTFRHPQNSHVGLFCAWEVRLVGMFSTIVGILFVLLGALWFRYPEALRRRLRRKALRKLRWYFFAAALSIGVLLISVGWKYEGLLPKILVIGGIIAILKGLFFLKSKAADEITEWLLNQPVLRIRIFAACQVALGLLILFGPKG